MSSVVEEVLAWVDEKCPMSVRGREMHYRRLTDLPECAEPLCGRVETLDLDADTLFERHREAVLRGALFLPFDLDRSHDVVTPFSWPAPTSFGGEPVPDSPFEGAASHVHALVHRGEGVHQGEFGSGYNNSNYWFGQVPRGRKVVRRMEKELAESPLIRKGESLNDACERAAKGGGGSDLVAECERLMSLEWRLVVEDLLACEESR